MRHPVHPSQRRGLIVAGRLLREVGARDVDVAVLGAKVDAEAKAAQQWQLGGKDTDTYREVQLTSNKKMCLMLKLTGAPLHLRDCTKAHVGWEKKWKIPFGKHYKTR